MRRFIQSWLINTLAVLVAGYVVSGIHYEKPLDLFVASLVLGILNAVIRPFLMLLTFPLLLFTLGLPASAPLQGGRVLGRFLGGAHHQHRLVCAPRPHWHQPLEGQLPAAPSPARFGSRRSGADH
jgi:hypothetical protein